MIYFSLPNLYNHTNLILKICELNKQIEKFKIPVQFVSIYESIPFCYLCGGININTNYILNYSDLQNKVNKHFGLTKRLNFSNLYIEKNDSKDEYFNLLLQLYENNSNWIEISNLPLAIELKEQNLLFDFIFSDSADVLFPFSEDNINTIIDQNIFKLISLPSYLNFNNFDLSKIQHCKFIELTINNICNNCSINLQKDCIKNEHNSIYNFSNNSHFLTCPNCSMYNDLNTINISIDDIQNIYLPLGITHYKLNNFPNIPNAFIDFIFFFVNYFIKEEYQQFVLEKLLKENYHD